MLVWFVSYASDAAPIVEGASSSAERAGAAIGVGLSWTFILIFWVGGAVIFGVWALLTRPPRMLVSREDV